MKCLEVSVHFLHVDLLGTRLILSSLLPTLELAEGYLHLEELLWLLRLRIETNLRVKYSDGAGVLVDF